MLKTFSSRIRSFSDHFLSARGVGHTALLLKGLKHFEGDVMLVAHTQSYAEQLAREAMDANPHIRITPRGLDVGNGLRGVRVPVAYDHAALLFLFTEAQNEISRLKLRLKGVQQSLAAIVDE